MTRIRNKKLKREIERMEEVEEDYSIIVEGFIQPFSRQNGWCQVLLSNGVKIWAFPDRNVTVPLMGYVTVEISPYNLKRSKIVSLHA